jgi:hypothetical protein
VLFILQINLKNDRFENSEQLQINFEKIVFGKLTLSRKPSSRLLNFRNLGSTNFEESGEKIVDQI